MKNLNEEEKKSLQSVNNKIWSIFDVLQNAHISPEDYPILLFLICLYKDGMLDESFTDHLERDKDLYKSIHSCNRDFSRNFGNEYESILPIFISSIEFLGSKSLKKIVQFIREIDHVFLSNHFETIFDEILHHITKSKITSVENHIQSAEITDLMIAIGKIKKGDSIYNPFAGLASFGVVSKNENLYLGQEVNKRAWALGQLRLIAFDKFNTHYLCQDSLNNWPDHSHKFDLIISSPPINLDLRSKYIKGQFIHTYKTAEQFVIEQSLHNLKKDGKLIICVTSGFLNRSHGEEHIITHLVENDLLEMIIPFQKHASMLYAILVINKNKKNSGKVAMYNTSKFIQKKNEWETEFNFNQLINFIKDNKQDDEVLKFVENDEIKKNDCILNVPRYFKKNIDGIRLGDVLEKINGQRASDTQTGKLIRTRDLKDRDIDLSIDLSKVEEIQFNRSDIQRISESCLLLASRWKSLKPTFFNYTDTSIYKGNDILAFRIDESKVDLSYLINELSADYVVKQLDSVRMGSVIPYLRISDLLDIKLKLPSLIEQKAKALGAFSAYKDSRIKESKLEDEINSIRENFNEELREKQHCIRQHLKNVVDSIAVINSFMAKQNGTININDVINPNRNVTVAQRFEAMGNSIRSLSLEIDNLTNDELYDKPELVGIRDILSQCILEFGDTLGFSIQENFDEGALDEYGDNNPKVSVSKRSFKELFNNIIMNASKHGFTEKRKYLININVTIKEGKLNVSFLNNGKPFVKGIAKQLGVKGKKAGINAGSGIGVWKVFEIAKHYGFECQIMDLPEEEFPVGWEFKFTLTEMI
jgi:type I restriction enzyme M protein